MKTVLIKTTVIIISILILGCDNDTSWDCVQTAGTNIQQDIPVDDFNKILVNQRTRLLIQQGPEYKVSLTTGSNLINDIDITVNSNDQLVIVNNNACNLVRDYGITTVTVTAPDITEIRSSTGLDIRSIGTISYPALTLYSENFGDSANYNATGDFYLNLDVNSLRIVTNNTSNFHLSGQVQQAFLEWVSGDGRLIAPDLTIQHAQIYHRGTNDWQIDVSQSITGTLLGYGNVILSNQPTSVNVQQTWTGRLIINN